MGLALRIMESEESKVQKEWAKPAEGVADDVYHERSSVVKSV